MAASLETQLAILQQCEYEWDRFDQWMASHRHSDEHVKPKKWTLKLKLLRFLAPILSLRGALLLLEVPKQLVISLLVALATIKLRWLQFRGLQVIAIAGSYGKTSTKYIANHVLTGSKKVLMTPENINTPIGIARVILYKLHSSHQIFLAELGEYYVGDIRALTLFLSPDFKILTPVGYAHLERFGSEENLKKGLMELVTTQPQKGKSFVHGADYRSEDLHDVQISRAGTEFVFSGSSYFIPLYGRHNALNCLPTLWLAKELGIEGSLVRERLSSLPFVPHRLEPTQLEHNILLLDNGYNANPASTKETLSVLSEMEGSQKIVCTPGYIELGPSQEKENEQLGVEIAKIADLCIIIDGVNSAAILRGLEKAKFPDDHIIRAKGEQEGMELLTKQVKPSAIILFENSIPELYKL
jgi:UDP-N-acetylmuramoyl-tripeptide--D-alanyl-D-alanine ligase